MTSLLELQKLAEEITELRKLLIAQYEKKIARLEQENSAMLEALEAVEWIQDNYLYTEFGDDFKYCPWCGSGGYCISNKGPEHAENCIRQKAVAKAKGK